MAEWNAIYEKGKAYEINFCSAKYEEAKAVEKVCDAIMDKNVSTPDDVQIVRHGKWIPIIDEYETLSILTCYKCSLCGRCENKEEPYCHCGARMDGD